MNDILAATKAVGFAEDAASDAKADHKAGFITDAEYIEVLQAAAYVRGIAARNIQPVEAA